MSQKDIEFAETDIAIIGMAARVPGANNIDEYWQNLLNGVESYEEYTREELVERGVPTDIASHPDYQKIARPLDNMEMFDAALFGFSPKEAAIMDPQHRHFLEVSWEALEHAGYDPAQYKGSIAVFGGSGHNAYMPYNLFTNPDMMKSIGLFLARHTSNDKDFLTTRVSYCLDLHGPSVNVQTACSTSLVAVHMACQGLLNGEFDMALAGGVTIELPHRVGYMYQDGEILSPDGHCRAFDAESKGTVFGSGAVQIVLKLMENAVRDGDTIHAIIKGSAINNDGSTKVGYLAPSVDGQSAAITEALTISDVDADTITYIETHGTGTPVGDPIEITALTQAYRTHTEKNGFCAVGSVKTNIGHLDTAAGGAGLIKIVLSMKNKKLPPSLNYSSPNPAIDFEDSPFYVNAALKDWETDGGPLRAGINSLGVGGTNAHVVLEEVPEMTSSNDESGYQLYCLSARSPVALDNLTQRVEQFLSNSGPINLADMAHTLRVGRKAQGLRRIVVAESKNDLVKALRGEDLSGLVTQKASDKKLAVNFMFTGQGSQYVNMSKDLYESEPVFKKAMDECAQGLEKYIEKSILHIIFPGENENETVEKLNQTSMTQPILFSIEYSLAKLLISWGIKPQAMIGHSIGEYVAACVSGLFSIDDALKLVAARGRLMQSLPKGSMLVVPLSENDLKRHLNESISIAAINAPGLCVVSGTDQDIDDFDKQMVSQDIECSRLHTSHAFHSAMMEPILDEFKSLFDSVSFGDIEIPFISNYTGDWASQELVSTADYWANHMRNTVRFNEGLAKMMQTNDAVFVECGPGYTLTTFARQHQDKQTGHQIIQTIRHPKQNGNDQKIALTALGRIWASGVKIDWEKFVEGQERCRIPLPTYPFEHQKHWIEPGKGQLDINPGDSSLHRQVFDEWFYQPGWTSTSLTQAVDKESITGLVIFINDSEICQSLINQYKNINIEPVVVKMGNDFDAGANHFEINPANEQHYSQLFKQLNGKISHIVHAWTIDEDNQDSLLDKADSEFERGFDSLFYIAKHFSSNTPDSNILMSVVTNNMYQVSSESLSQPVKATMLGPAKVMSQEVENLVCKAIDIDLSAQSILKMQHLCDALCNETLIATYEEDVAYRGFNRFIRSYKRVLPVESYPVQIRESGNYLLTGGVGGIGRELAKFLISKFKTNLIIINRTALPERSEWATYVEKNQDKVSERISILQELESMGATIYVITADVTDSERLAVELDAAKNKLGEIHGIFHNAGLANDNLIAFKSIKEAHEVMSPKVEGLISLDKALANDNPDFIFLFSSISSLMGLSGQIDYTAANAFMDAYAVFKQQQGARVISANWGVWSDIGMAAKIGQEKGITGAAQDIKHYFFDNMRKLGANITDYSVRLSASTHWIIDEHRSRNGTALIPGTAYLELARSAFSGNNNDGIIRLSDVFFLSPFVIEGKEEKTLHAQLTTTPSTTEFLIKSEYGEENVRGSVSYVEAKNPEQLNIDSIMERCDKKIEERTGTAEHKYLLFGDRWKCTNRIHFGKKEALVEIEMPDKYVDELSDYILHPAIMDMATGTAQSLNHDYDSDRDLYIPISYSNITIYKGMCKKMYSHVVYEAEEGQGGQTSIFNVKITDEYGNILIDVDKFVMKRIDPSVLSQLKSMTGGESMTPEKTPSELFFEMGLNSGISSDEGMRAIEQIINGLRLPGVIVSPLEFSAYMHEARRLRNIDSAMEEDEEQNFNAQDRPSLLTDFVPAQTELEKAIEKIWRISLGLSEVGINDDFFELGGHSLLLTQVVSRLKKHLKVDMPINELFETPTIASWTSVLKNNEANENVSLPPVIPVNRMQYVFKRADVMISA